MIRPVSETSTLPPSWPFTRKLPPCTDAEPPIRSAIVNSPPVTSVSPVKWELSPFRTVLPFSLKIVPRPAISGAKSSTKPSERPVWLNTSEPVPLPNSNPADLSVPALAACSPDAAPILIVPVELEMLATSILPTPLAAVTVAPSAMVRMPVPAYPTLRLPLLVQLEPRPVTKTSPWAPDEYPTNPADSFDTAPPFITDSEPFPSVPTYRVSLSHAEPLPATVTMPRASPARPMKPVALDT